MPSFVEAPTQRWVKPTRDTSNNFDFTPCDENLARDYVQGSIITPVRILASAGASAPETKITDGTDTLLVNSDGSVNTTSVEKEMQRAVFDAQNQTAATAFGTVPANKIWKIYGWNHSAHNSASAAVRGAVILANGISLSRLELNAPNATGQGVANANNFDEKYIKLTAGQTLQHQVTNATVIHSGVVFYIEESV